MKSTVLDVYGLKKLYKEDRGIKEVTFKLPSEHILGFIGPNGSGKSTTIKTILGLLKKENGTVKIFGKNIDKFYTDIMQFVGYFPSDNSVYEDLIARDFLKYSASFYEIDFNESIEELAQRLNVELDVRIKDMSYGNKKKVGLINALFINPKLIILDEPTLGLDPSSQIELLNIIRERKATGAGILFCSNDLSVIQEISDEFMIIKDGVIVNSLSRSEFRKNNKKVKVTTEKAIDSKSFDIPSIKELVIEENVASFLFAGDINELVKRLGKFNIIDLSIDDPSLDELLLHYYE